MKYRLASDLHLEFYGKHKRTHVPMYNAESLIAPLPTDSETVLLLAGDIGIANKTWSYKPFMEDLSSRFKAIVYVLGNHEYYRGSMDSCVDKIKAQVSDLNVYVLDDTSIVIDDVTIIGSTLWTDYDNNDGLLKSEAKLNMNDYKLIRISRGEHLYGRAITPNDLLQQHLVSKQYIFDELASATTPKSLVMTHHAPMFTSVSKEYVGDDLNGCYASDLSNELEVNGPDVWVHGHIHSNSDYVVGETRVLANPRGYIDDLNYNYNNSIVFEL